MVPKGNLLFLSFLTTVVPLITPSSGGKDALSPTPTRSSTKVNKLTILGLFELTENKSRGLHGPSEKFAAELAITHVNKRRVLGKYKLTMLTNDTQCDAGVGMDAFFHALYTQKERRIISLLGTSCPEVTERLAKVVPYWNIVQVSFGSMSPSLSDQKEFPFFYRTVSPLSAHNEAILTLIKHFQWDTVSFLAQNQNRFTMPMNMLVTELEKGNVTCRATLTFSPSDLRDQLEELKEVDARIIIASFTASLAPTIFCHVHRLGLFGRDYAWILLGRPERSWWVDDLKEHKNDLNCTLNQLRQAIENTLIVDRHNVLPHGIKSLAGIAPSEFRSKFKDWRMGESPFAPEAYDAVWTIALALKNLTENSNMSLEDFDYTNRGFANNFMTQIKSLAFNGISGPISFFGSDRIGITSFMQIHNTKIKTVGLYFPQESILDLNCSDCSVLRWHGNQVPIARRDFRFKLIRVEGATLVGVFTVSATGILLALIFLIFNIYNRKLKFIKLSSPRLNNFVIIGCIFVYVAVILLGLDLTSPESDGKDFAIACTVRAYLLSTGFSLAFGSMFAKTYRVYRIFTRSCIGVVKNKLLRDRQLMMVILTLLVMDCLILTSWAVVDPMNHHRLNITLAIDPDDRSVVYQLQIQTCRSEHLHVWLIVVYGYKSLLLAVGLYMAWETRHVKIPVLNDSKYIGLSVYVIVLASVLAVSLANLLWDKVSLSFFAVTSLILTATTVTLCLLFLPKIHTILQKKHLGDPVVESSGLKIECNTRRLLVEDSKELLFRAEVQNRVYKRQIEAIDAEMWRLEKKLMTTTPESIERAQGPKATEVKSGDEETCSESSGEIFTVYLHRPRFIIPISLLSLQNRSGIADLGSVASFAASALTGPRSSWPITVHADITKGDTRGISRGVPSSNFRVKSEPKLSHLQEEDAGSIAVQEKAVSAESCMSSLGRLESTTAKSSSSRKDSGASDGSKRATFLSVLKFPLNYMGGLFLPQSTSSTGRGTKDKLEMDAENGSSELKSELWGIRTSPCLERNKRTTSVIDATPSLQSKSIEFLSSSPLEEPILRLIPTTSPSPLL